MPPHSLFETHLNVSCPRFLWRPYCPEKLEDDSVEAGLWRFGGVLGGVGHKLRLPLLKRPGFFGGSCSRPPSRKIVPP